MTCDCEMHLSQNPGCLMDHSPQVANFFIGKVSKSVRAESEEWKTVSGLTKGNVDILVGDAAS